MAKMKTPTARPHTTASTLPTLHSVSHAQLAAAYEEAKKALTACVTIDECRQWANKVQALASYAKQADDKILTNHCERIRARVVRRCGELLKEMTPTAKVGQPKNNCAPVDTILSRSEAAKQSGLSPKQKNTALRVAHVPQEVFEHQVESDHPPTVTELKRMGTQTKPTPKIDIGDRDPADVKAATRGQGALRWLVDATKEVTPAQVARGSLHWEYDEVLAHIVIADAWLTELNQCIQKEKHRRLV